MPWTTSRLVALSSTTRMREPGAKPAAANSPGAWPAACPKGSSTQNTEPAPGWLETPMAPPINSATCLEIARPRPVPPKWRVVEASAWLKGWNSFASVGASMPTPLSETLKRSQTPPSAGASRGAGASATTTCPACVNLMALPLRLPINWRRRTGSPATIMGAAASMSQISSRPFCCALWASRPTLSSTTCQRLKSMRSRSSLPASILEKSRMSLRMPSSACAER